MISVPEQLCSEPSVRTTKAQERQQACSTEGSYTHLRNMPDVPLLSPEEQVKFNELYLLTDRLLAGETCGMTSTKIERLLERRTLADAGNPRALLGRKPTGRPSVAADLSKDAKDTLRRLVMKANGSVALAATVFADHPLCPDSVADAIKNSATPHTIPLSIRRAANVTPEASARFRGPRQYQHTAFKCRHNDLVSDPVSKELRPLQAGDIYVSDDMSRNRYFWFELPEHDRTTRQGRGDRLAEKFGVALGRQGLYTMDAAGKWLGVSLIGCARDAYNSADVLRHFRQIIADCGKPRLLWTLEKGVWASRAIDGTEVYCEADERNRLVGHVSSLGFNVEHAHTSEGKALIEGGFNYLQSVMSLYEGGVDIGRTRGEMEAETKLIQRVQAGTLHPRDAGIEHISVALENDLKAMVFCNSRTKAGRIQHGVPDERWIQDTIKNPLKQLAPSENGILMPTKIETEIRQGCVEKKIAGELFRFTMPELFGQLGQGYRLFVCFDECNPSAGADIYNLETGSRNIFNWSPRQYIGHAEHETARTLCGWTPEDAEGVERRKAHHRAVVTAYAGTGIFGKRNRKAIEQRDGKGGIALVEINKTKPVQATRPPSPEEIPVYPPDRNLTRQTRPSVEVPARRSRIKSRLELLEV